MDQPELDVARRGTLLPGEAMIRVLLCSMVVACVSFTLAESEITSGYRRMALRAHPWLGKLTQCAYCTSHWVSLCVVTALRADPGWGSVAMGAFVSLPLTVLLVVWLATPQWILIGMLMGRAGK